MFLGLLRDDCRILGTNFLLLLMAGGGDWAEGWNLAKLRSAMGLHYGAPRGIRQHGAAPLTALLRSFLSSGPALAPALHTSLRPPSRPRLHQSGADGQVHARQSRPGGLPARGRVVSGLSADWRAAPLRHGPVRWREERQHVQKRAAPLVRAQRTAPQRSAAQRSAGTRTAWCQPAELPWPDDLRAQCACSARVPNSALRFAPSLCRSPFSLIFQYLNIHR